jgi:hypothetical protein
MTRSLPSIVPPTGFFFFSETEAAFDVDPVKDPGPWKEEVGEWMTDLDSESLAEEVTERTRTYLGPFGATRSQIRWVVYRRVKEEGRLKEEFLMRLHDARCMSSASGAVVEGATRKKKRGGSDEEEGEEDESIDFLNALD